MFTDELAGNPAKKRADEAKARRIRAKREKEAKEARKRKELERRQKEEQEATLASSHEVAGSGVKENPPASSSATSAAIAVRSVEKGRGATEPDAPLNAAQKAAEQRRIRAEARAKIAASKTIQSCVRSKLTASKVREQQRNIYDKRMSDLIALTAILKRSSTQEYVPPPATVSIMTTQFLFFACPATIRKKGSNGDIAFDNGSFILEERDLSRWTKLVNHLLLPGILDTNLDLDPLLPWVESANGRKRLNYVLTLLISSVARRQIKAKKPFGATAKANSVGQDSNELLAAVDLILRALLRLKKSAYTGGNRDIIHQKVCSLLIKSSAPSYSNYFQPKSATANIQHQEYHKFTPDLISSLRSLLLFGSNGVSEPIPPDAERMREDCTAKDEKCRADVLTKLIIDFISCMESGSGSDQENQGRLCSRFVSEILTVPLFTWKVNLSSYESLIQSQGLKPPPLVDYIRHFNNTFTNEVSDGRIAIALNMTDISLSTCPAPPVLCLLSNVIQIGNKCDTINGTIASKLHYTAAAEYFNFVATLINVAPLGTFSSKMSAVEWVSNGSTSSPIVLSNVVIEQAAVFLSDSFVRSLFNCAIDDDVLMTRKVIDNKTEKDMKQENDLTELGSSSVTSLAAKEAMVDRNRRFWQSSKWAKKLSNFISSAGEKMTSSEASSPGPNDSRTGKGKLMNTSSLSRQLANGKGSSISRVVTSTELSSSESDSRKTSTSKPQHVYSASFFFALCRAYATIISRWGGNGKEDLVRRVSSKAGELEIEAASAKLEPCVTALLNVLCFSTNILSSSWAIIQSNPKVVSDLYCVIDVTKGTAPIRTLTCHNACGSNEGNIGASLLLMFVTCLSHTLMVTDDVELHEMEKPLPKHQVRRCILLLKKLLYRAVCLDDAHNATKITLPSNHLGLALISVSSKVMNDLYSRSSRRLLCVPKLWIEEDLLEQDIRRCKSHLDYTSLLASPVCRICPFLVSFKRRLKLFERIVTTNRIDIQGSNEQRNLKRGIMVKVQRGRVLEDGLIHLNNLGRNMRQRICVNYISDVGTSESGVDVGGLFKEFWTDLSALAFDPNYALFKVTEDALMYPNPSSKFVHGGDMSMKLFEFLGRILGKALYEGITIQPQFAHLFLSFLKGDHSYLHLLTDLSTIDTQLYNNLMFLKTYEGDAADLCLTFTVANDDFGVSEQNLIPNGADIEVTNGNKRRYIYLVAKHHVCDRIKEQADAFCRGLWEVIDRSWLRLFNEPELQVLISGASDGKIDVSDMKANSKYTGGYSQLDRNVIRFWSVVSSLTPKQQADLLRFVTSCERPPPLGFASMSPPFTIQRVGIMRDGDKLPSASTCFNTLKLPTYSSEKVLKERLIYAIESKSGFELT